MAEEIFRRGREKKVSITIPDPTDPDIHKEIIRRQTGFVRPEDLTRMRQFVRPEFDNSDDLSDDELDDYLPYTRQVSIQPPSVTSYKTKSDLGRPDIKDKKDLKVDKSTIQETLHEEIGEEIEQRLMSESEEFDIPLKVDISATVPKIIDAPEQQSRIAREKRRESHQGAVGWKSGSDFRATRISDFEDGKRDSDFDDGKQRRMSVLKRLIDDVATDQDPGPTLKDYKPLSEKQQKGTLFLLTYSPEKHIHLTNKGDDPRELYFRRRTSITMHMNHPQNQHKSIDHILGLQHGKGVYRKISTDYVKTIDQIEQKEQNSLRGLEYAKHRPAISVKEYQKQNRQYNKRLELSKPLKEKHCKGKHR